MPTMQESFMNTNISRNFPLDDDGNKQIEHKPRL
jgi:hypothetical protein